MEFREVVRRRRMVRDYDPDRGVPAAVVQRVLEHAVRAPSAGFSQGWDFVVLDDRAAIERYWEAATGPSTSAPDAWLRGMRRAPVLVVCLGHREAYLERYAEPDKGVVDRDRGGWPVDYWDVDTGMAALLMLLTAVDQGLGACFFGVPVDRHDPVRDALGIPPDRSFVGVVSLGHPAPGERPSGSPTRRARRPLGEVVHRRRFASPWPG